MNHDFNKTLAMLGGVSEKEFDLGQVYSTDKQEIDNAIDTIVQGVSLKHWAAGMNLGDAWRASGHDIKAMAGQFTDRTPVVLYVHETAFKKARNLENLALGSPDSQNLIRCSAQQRIEWTTDAEQRIEYGMNIIRKKIIEYKPGAPRTAQPVKNMTGAEIQNHIIEKYISREMGRENERIRELKK